MQTYVRAEIGKQGQCGGTNVRGVGPPPPLYPIHQGRRHGYCLYRSDQWWWCSASPTGESALLYQVSCINNVRQTLKKCEATLMFTIKYETIQGSDEWVASSQLIHFALLYLNFGILSISEFEICLQTCLWPFGKCTETESTMRFKILHLSELLIDPFLKGV